MAGASFTAERMRLVAFGLALLAGLFVVQHYNYLLFHAVAETFGIVIGCGIFFIAWNARRVLENHYLVWVGIAYLFVGVVSLVHTLGYPGMGVFEGQGANLSTQLWIAARFIESLSLLAAPLFFRRRLSVWWAFAGFSTIVSVLFLAIFRWHVYPECYDETARHLTTFKVASEYIVCAIFLASLALLWRNQERLERRILYLLSGSFVLSVGAELSFTVYTDPYGVANVAGHYLMTISFFLIYKALIETGLTRPFELMFRNLKHTQDELTALNQTLEWRVAERTAEAERRAVELRALALELTRAEDRERRRLALVLHDHLQQTLVAAKLRLGALGGDGAPRDEQESAAKAGELLNRAIKVSRSLAVELSPPILNAAGLFAALDWLATWMKDNHGLEVELAQTKGAEPAREEVRSLVFQSVRELLFNVVKHAGEKRARVAFPVTNGHEVRIVVEDAGRGFDATSVDVRRPADAGFGLCSIRERLHLLGGRLEIDSAPGRGTRITVVAPVE